MPIRFSIEPAKEMVRTTISGPILEADPVRYLSEVLDHPDYRPGYRALVVCTDVELGTFSSAAIRRFARFTRAMEQELNGSRVAIVAPKLALYGLVRMYQLVRSPPYEVAVFRELSEAEAWLGGSDAGSGAG